MKTLKLILTASLMASCGAESDNTLPTETTSSATIGGSTSESNLKLNNPECIDPDLTRVANTTSLMLCDGTIVSGKFEVPDDLNEENFVAENIKAGVSIAGITGTYEGETQVVTETKTVTEYVTAEGVTYTECSDNGQTGCLTTTSLKSADLSNLSAEVIKSGITIAGVTGNLVEENHSDCSANGQTGCVTTNSFKAADLSNLNAGNIKAGASIAGISGQYPSATYPLSSSTGTADLYTSTFEQSITSDDAFEWFDSEGNRHTANGNSAIAESNIMNNVEIFGVTGVLTTDIPKAEDLRAGVTMNGVTGAIKTNCRNTAFSTQFSKEPGAIDNLTGSTTTTGDLQWWDTLEDIGYWEHVIMPHIPVDWTTDNVCGSENWEIDTSVSACDTAGDYCVVKDKTSGLEWANLTPSDDFENTVNANDDYWADAVTKCLGLTRGGHTDWRLPTQKEMMQAYVSGIARSNIAPFIPSTSTDFNPTYFTATTVSENGQTDHFWSVNLRNGRTMGEPKTAIGPIMCVR